MMCYINKFENLFMLVFVKTKFYSYVNFPNLPCFCIFWNVIIIDNKNVHILYQQIISIII